MSLDVSQREAARHGRETTCMVLLVGFALIAGVGLVLSPLAKDGPIGLAMAFGLVVVPAVAPLLAYVIYGLMHQPPPMPRLVVVLPGLACAAASVLAASRFDPATLLPVLDPVTAPLATYVAVALANAAVVWVLWAMTRSS